MYDSELPLTGGIATIGGLAIDLPLLVVIAVALMTAGLVLLRLRRAP